MSGRRPSALTASGWPGAIAAASHHSFASAHRDEEWHGSSSVDSMALPSALPRSLYPAPQHSLCAIPSLHSQMRREACFLRRLDDVKCPWPSRRIRQRSAAGPRMCMQQAFAAPDLAVVCMDLRPLGGARHRARRSRPPFRSRPRLLQQQAPCTGWSYRQNYLSAFVKLTSALVI